MELRQVSVVAYLYACWSCRWAATAWRGCGVLRYHQWGASPRDV